MENKDADMEFARSISASSDSVSAFPDSVTASSDSVSAFPDSVFASHDSVTASPDSVFTSPCHAVICHDFPAYVVSLLCFTAYVVC